METEVVWTLIGVLVTLLGISVAIIAMQRRNGKNGNPGVSVHLARLEGLGEQQVQALGDVRTELRDIGKELTGIQNMLGKLEGTVGSCGAVQQLRQRGD